MTLLEELGERTLHRKRGGIRRIADRCSTQKAAARISHMNSSEEHVTSSGTLKGEDDTSSR